MLAVSLLAGAAALGGLMPWRRRLVRMLSDLVRWEGRNSRLVVGHSAIGAMAVGSAMFLGGAWGAVVLSSGARTGPVGSPPFQYSAPNTPVISALAVVDTSTVWVQGGAFVGSGDDTHDSIWVAITRVGSDTTAIIAQSLGGAQTRDTVASNDSLKADTTYKAWLKYRGDNGGWSAWSAPDTFVNSVGDASNVLFGCVWPTTGHSDAAVQNCGSRDWAGEPSYSNGSSDTVFVVKSASGLDFPTTNVLGVVANGDAGALWVTTTENHVPSTAVESGDTISRRFYFRVTAPNTGEDNTHATHDGSTQDNESHNTSIEQYNLDTSSTWVIEILHGPSGDRAAFRLTGSRSLSKNTTYIYRDWVVIGSTTSVLRAQIFDSGGDLLYDVDDFASSQGSGTNMSTGISKSFGAPNGATGYRQFQLGINGFSPASASSFAYYYGAFAICSGLCPVVHIPGEGQP